MDGARGLDGMVMTRSFGFDQAVWIGLSEMGRGGWRVVIDALLVLFLEQAFDG